MRDENGRVIGGVLVFRDITERRAAEMELLEAKAAADLLAAAGQPREALTLRQRALETIAPTGDRVLASASTLDKSLRAELSGSSGNVQAATLVGKAIAERAKEAGIEAVAFDRSGFRYHGRVKALAEAARENGLQF